jgi:hypothetical protein
MQPSRGSKTSTAEPLIALLLIVAATGALSVAWYVPAHARYTAEAQERECRGHLLAIYQAIQRYRSDHHGQYPDSLAPSPFKRQPPIASLAPRYLSVSQLLCPADETGGVKPGWKDPFSYNYELQELSSSVPEVRRRVRKGLIDKYGPKLRLINCGGFHRNPPMGALTLHADGQVYKEFWLQNDPQETFRQSLWALEAARPPRQRGIRPGRGWPPKPPGAR